jgi:hypothetical protein
MALTTFESHDWIGIFTYSLSSLQTIRHHYSNIGTSSSMHYHHHLRLLGSITDLLKTKRVASFRTTLHKTRAHTNIRGNDFADVVVKLAVTDFDTLPPTQNNRVDTGEILLTHWVMYTVKPLVHDQAVSSGTNRAPIRRP